MGLSFELGRRYEKLMVRFEVFTSHQELYAVFKNNAEIAPYADKLPEATNKEQRIKLVTALLMDAFNENGSVLVRFLEVIKHSVPENDERARQLQDMIPQVSDALRRRDAEDEYRKVAQVYVEGESRRSAVKSTNTEGGPSPAEMWLEEAKQRGADELAFRIALAVLSGSEYRAFTNAYKALAERLKDLFPSEKEEPGGSRPKALPGPESKRLRDAGAIREERERQHTRGTVTETVSIRVVELRDEHLKWESLSYVWEEYTFLRDHLADWLTSLIPGHASDIRARTAVAAGVMAISDFAGVRDYLLVRWAQSEEHHAEYRAAVGRALGVTATNEKRAVEVAALLRLWTASDRALIRWTAARAYLYVGALLPASEAIKQWRSLLSSEVSVVLSQSGDAYLNPLIVSIIDAVGNFFMTVGAADKPGDALLAVLSELKVWIEDDKARRASEENGLFVFSILMEAGRNIDAEHISRVPLLLSLIDPTDPRSNYRQIASDVFHLAMRSEKTLEDVRDCFEAWIDQIGKGIDGEKQLLSLLRDIIERDRPHTRVRELIKFYLEKWKPKRGRQGASAGRILEELI